MNAEEVALRKKIAQWQEEGKTAEKMRKRRTHVLIQLGAVTLNKMKVGEVNQEEILSELPEKKQEEVRKWITTSS